MKKILGILVLGLIFCSNSISADVVSTPNKVRTMNKERLTKLELGMNETEVFMIMGTKTISIFIKDQSDTIENPYKTEVYGTEKDVYKIFYYYTDFMKGDGLITDDELTPIILKNNELMGWGRAVWDKIGSAEKFSDLTPSASNP